jgi:hypothetical protein
VAFFPNPEARSLNPDPFPPPLATDHWSLLFSLRQFFAVCRGLTLHPNISRFFENSPFAGMQIDSQSGGFDGKDPKVDYREGWRSAFEIGALILWQRLRRGVYPDPAEAFAKTFFYTTVV